MTHSARGQSRTSAARPHNLHLGTGTPRRHSPMPASGPGAPPCYPPRTVHSYWRPGDPAHTLDSDRDAPPCCAPRMVFAWQRGVVGCASSAPSTCFSHSRVTCGLRERCSSRDVSWLAPINVQQQGCFVVGSDQHCSYTSTDGLTLPFSAVGAPPAWALCEACATAMAIAANSRDLSCNT